eukprot:2970082-Rhodomonas_salina.3
MRWEGREGKGRVKIGQRERGIVAKRAQPEQESCCAVVSDKRKTRNERAPALHARVDGVLVRDPRELVVGHDLRCGLREQRGALCENVKRQALALPRTVRAVRFAALPLPIRLARVALAPVHPAVVARKPMPRLGGPIRLDQVHALPHTVRSDVPALLLLVWDLVAIAVCVGVVPSDAFHQAEDRGLLVCCRAVDAHGPLCEALRLLVQARLQRFVEDVAQQHRVRDRHCLAPRSRTSAQTDRLEERRRDTQRSEAKSDLSAQTNEARG